LIAYAQYSDGSTVDVTDQVGWVSSDSALAQVSNADGSRGQVFALGMGTVNISAQLESISSTQAVEVTAAVLQQIQITDSSTDTFYTNQQRSLDAVGTYSDGSQQSLNQQVQWMSSDAQVVAASNASDSMGVLTALAPGSASISASFSGITSNVLSFQIVDNPNAPASISISAAPNVILNDGADSTTLTATVQPLQTSGVIADGTEVNFIIKEDTVTRIVPGTTVNGIASIPLTSIYNGFIVITAEVANTDLSATTAVYSTDNFAKIFQIVPGAKAVLINDNTVYQQGSQFVIFIRNLSNRDFDVLEYRVKNGGVNFPESPVTDSAYLSGGVLQGGEYTVAGYQLDADTTNNTISIEYVLKDTPSQKVFGFSFSFNTL
jgi:trimeric autotransporter adhesin